MGSIKKFFRQDRDYFLNNQADIVRQNGRVMRIACLIYLVILAIFTTITIIEGRSKLHNTMYLVYDAAHLIICVAVFSKWADKESGRVRERLLRVALVITVLSFFLLEAVFPYPDEQSIYFPFPLILTVTIFAMEARKVLFIIISYVSAFVVLVLLFKSPEIRLNEIYVAAGTFISALTGYIVVAIARHETGGAIVRLKSMSMTDPMTGLYNKRTFESLCRSCMGDSERERGYALLFFDVDNFKVINDRYGHQFGDKVLKGVAEVMSESFYDKDYLGRFGGDEFVVFMVDVRSEANVHERVRIFCENINELGKTLGMDKLSCSVGSAMRGEGHESYNELLTRADAALYVAKESGRQQVSYAEREFISQILATTGAKPNSSGRLSRIADTGERIVLKRRVLVVDDNEMNRLLLRRILSDSYDVLEAQNGEVALAMLKEWHSSFSAVLLDIVMPVMDGCELLKIMRADDELKSIPVIVTTGYGEEEMEIRALSLGANDFVVKPYRPAIIIHRLQNNIHLRETNAILDAVRADY